MIQIKKENKKISIIGHANYDKYGKDIVCASVSSVVLCTINGILKINYEALEVKKYKDKLEININCLDKVTITLIDNMMDCLQELTLQYPNNIKIID